MVPTVQPDAMSSIESLAPGKMLQSDAYVSSGRYREFPKTLFQADGPFIPKSHLRCPVVSVPVRQSYEAPVYELPEPLEGRVTRTVTVGVGAFATVYKAEWQSPEGTAFPVAVKLLRRSLDPEYIAKRIRREALIWERINHPNILSFIGYQFVDGEAALVSPWRPQGNLMDYLRERDHTTASHKLQLLLGVARGLDCLHSYSPPIVHGDIKPPNILIQGCVTSQICDFGLSTWAIESQEDRRQTTSGPTVGSVRFQAPELLLELSQSTTMSDVYAFGGLTLATMSGKSPFFKKKTAAAIILAICRDETASPTDHPELPADDPIWELCRRCWDPEPNSRPTMAQIIRELEAQIQQCSPLR